jgi:hypothetical protein
MNFELEIVNELKSQERELVSLKAKKQNSITITDEKVFLLESEKKQAYIDGMRKALYIMQKKRN